MRDLNRKLFLSYAWQDDQPFVQGLYGDLKKHGYEPWMDMYNMSSRGRSLPTEVIESLSACARFIPIIGQGWLASVACQAEMDYTLSVGNVISPVLRDERINFADLSGELTKFLIIDFRPPREYEDAFKDLLRILREPPLPPGPLFGVPNFPPNYQARELDLKAVRDAMDIKDLSPVALLAARHQMALQGMGGVGKTVIAIAYARDYQTRRRFIDGVIWTSVRRNAVLLNLFRYVGNALHVKVSDWKDHRDARLSLQQCLYSKACLVVLDDIWDLKYAQAFLDILGPQCRLLLTTRDERLANAIGARISHVNRLSHEQAFSLLAESASVQLEHLPNEAREVAQECGNLPFALAQCGAVIRNGNSWRDLLVALRNADISYFSERLPNYEYSDVFRAIQVTVDFIARQEPQAAKRYFELAVFPPTEIPEDIAVLFWTRHGGVSESHARKLLTTLHNLALIERLSGEMANRRFSLHDLQVDYVRKSSEGHLSSLHDELLDLFKKHFVDWQLGPSESYVFDNLAYHIEGSGRTSRVRELIADKSFLRALALHGHNSNRIYEDFKRVLLTVPLSERQSMDLYRYLSFPEEEEGPWYRHYHKGDLKSLSLCLELHYVNHCGAIDPSTRCHVCNSEGTIIHGTIDIGGYTPADYNDNYIAWCINCSWSYYEFEIDYNGTGPASFDYSSNTYST